MLIKFKNRAIDKQIERIISVFNHYDLNTLSTVKNPFQIEDTKVVCCGPCSSFVTGHLSIPRSKNNKLIFECA